MSSAPPAMRRFWWSCLIMLGLLALAARGGVLVGAWLPSRAPGDAIVAGAWAPLGSLLAAGLLGGLLFWRGRRLLLGTLCSAGLLLLVAAAWAGTYRHCGYASAGLRYGEVAQARLLDGRLVSLGGRLGVGVTFAVGPPGYLGDLYGTHNPGLRLYGFWTPEASERWVLVGRPLRDWSWLRWCGFEVVGHRSTSTTGVSIYQSGLIVPYWFVVPCLLIYPALYGRMCWKRAHAPAGPRCAKCGYDLRGHASAAASPAASAKCPECGTPISAAAPVPPEA